MHSYFIPSQIVYFVFNDSYWNFWISSYDGLFKVSAMGSISKFESTNIQFGLSQLLGMCQDKKKNIWMNTDNGLFKYVFSYTEIKDVEEIPLPFPSAYENYVSAVNCSTDGTLWAAVPHRYSVISMSSDVWTKYSIADPMGGFINQIVPDKHNNTYFVSNNQVLKHTNSGAFEHLSILEMGIITSLYIDSDENVYIAGSTAIKIIKTDGTTELISTKINGLTSNPQIMSITRDIYKNIWLGTSNYGLVKFKYWRN